MFRLPKGKRMPQDVTFDLPFDTPVSDHLEYARARHLRWIWDMGLVRSPAGFEEYRSWDLPQAAARTHPHASAAELAGQYVDAVADADDGLLGGGGAG